MRRPTSRISSRSCVATRTVVPPALTSRNRFMISSDKSGSRFPVGSSASEARTVDERAGDRHALLLAARIRWIRARPMLQPDPLQHLKCGAAAGTRVPITSGTNETFSTTVRVGISRSER